MKVCFITSEVFIGKRRGGFGKIVRIVGRELVRQGFDVSVICWREPGEESLTELDGMAILSYPYDFSTRASLKHILEYAEVIPLIKQADADVYVSIDCMVETYIAQKVMPDRKHVIWVQDPFDEADYRLLGSVDPNFKFRPLKFWATVAILRRAYKRADLVLTSAKYFVPKITRLFGVDSEKVAYLPNPVEYVPNEKSIAKSKEPTVYFLGRMDPQKRYWLFFELAKGYPDIKFVAVGSPSLLYEKLYKLNIRSYRKLRNLKIMGFVNDETKFEILSKSCILCLPSIREGLPLVFLEACAHKTAILSSVNPDNFTSNFGHYVRDHNFEYGLKRLIERDLWKEKSKRGYAYVKKVHQLGKVVEECLKWFLKLSEK